MKILADDGLSALCEGGGRIERVDMLLVGQQPVGAYVLAHLGVAMRVLEEDEARLIGAALQGLDAALSGGDFEAHFADLINREPTLPEHLQPRAPEKAKP